MDMPSSSSRPAIGCVSFLNAKPLIDGLDRQPDLSVRFHVPSRLLEGLLAGEVDVALCPVIDYQQADQPLTVVPVGAIGSDGPTHTVRLFSRIPLEQVTAVHADTDSHTSVMLTRLVLHDLYHRTPQIVDYRPAAGEKLPQTLLLIGDKVVTDCPDEREFPHQLDLGEAWRQLTGLPFVFAVWTTRRGVDLGDLPQRLEAQRQANGQRIDQIVAAHAPQRRWPLDLARRYLGHLMRYTVGERELQAMNRFWRRAHELGLTPRLRPMVLYPDAAPVGGGDDGHIAL